ncbi:carbohydrate sulfotransferase 1-like isoform X2 [Littorina saxatilis]|uniref:carbohydrate sulfotransferase 1-like isoform X2 n=1 Tax=Littorina saxatilis TaxID=31220 RepID=UPI0038B6293E
MDPPPNQFLGLMLHRLTKKKPFVLLLIPAAFLLYVSFQASRSLLSTASGPLANHLYLQTVHRDSDPGSNGGKIILMTYGRSGSSFTSEIIQQDPGVFYTFEPLYNMVHRYIGPKDGKKKVVYPNTTDLATAYDKESIEIMEVFLTCGFESMNSRDINNFQLRNSADSRLLWGCVQRKGNWTPVDALDCFIKARKACFECPVKMVKTIRIRGSAVRKMMEKHPDLKIIYLIRDPRGTLASQKRVFNNFKWEETANFSANYCQTFREDLAEIGQLLERFPGRLRLLRYENMAENPLKEAEAMYRFLGLDFTPTVREFVFNKTMAGQKGKSAYSTSRQNSTETANSWRKKLTIAVAMTIDRNCKDIYQHLGYLPVNTLMELTDFSHSLKKKVAFHGQEL